MKEKIINLKNKIVPFIMENKKIVITVTIALIIIIGIIIILCNGPEKR